MKNRFKFFLILNISLFGCNFPNSNNQKDYTFNLRGDTLEASGKLNEREWIKTYYDNGQLLCSSSFVNSKLDGVVLLFTENGDTAKKEVWKNGYLFESLVFWETVPFSNDRKHYLISNEGYYKFRDGKPIDLDANPIEGLVKLKYSDDREIYYVYKNGEWELYPNPRLKKK